MPKLPKKPDFHLKLTYRSACLQIIFSFPHFRWQQKMLPSGGIYPVNPNNSPISPQDLSLQWFTSQVSQRNRLSQTIPD
ncbi:MULTISPECIES: hypothetical protein [Cyanophyceae]|uniref:hypothetical protein n=1 Tax=Cyanophyceae TaxID=3028117 RepID=UPI0016820E2D|nr:hypothetical protein [Trichocoleus sp. FACHB-40]MBD2004084.1 hypothetical protein [Trichocoleus sp. FACHB-40]